MQRENVAYVRFSDDIKVFCSDHETATAMFSRISGLKECGLKLSEKKCGVFQSISHLYFGYEFSNTRNGIIIQRKGDENMPKVFEPPTKFRF